MKATIDWLRYCFLWVICRHEVELHNITLPAVHQILTDNPNLGLHCLKMVRRGMVEWVPLDRGLAIGRKYVVVVKFFRKSDAVWFKLSV